MSLQQWAADGWLRPHKPTRKEMADFLAIVDRDMEDSQGNVSADWRFGIAYNAALKLCTVLLHASGYRPEKTLARYRTLAALMPILGDTRKRDADYLDACRMKRNTVEYDMAGAASKADALELLEFVRGFRKEVLAWLHAHHPELVPQRRR